MGQDKGAQGRDEDGAGGLAAEIALAPPPHDHGAEGEHDGGQGVGEVEADVLLGVDHGDLADEGADVDEEVEPVVDALGGDGGVDDDALARLERLDKHVLLAELLDDEAADVGLEAAGADADDDDGDEQERQGGALPDDDGGNGRHDEHHVPAEVDAEGRRDGLVAAPFGVGDPGAEEGHEVLPELVEGGDARRGALAHAQSAGLVDAGPGDGAFGEPLLDEVCDCGGASARGLRAPSGPGPLSVF